MKRMISVLIAFVAFLSCANIAFAEAIMLSDFEVTKDGELTAYYGGEWVEVPNEVDGVPVVKIGDKAFFDLGISDVYISNGIAEIGKSAFEGCNTEAVSIPSTTEIIGERAFAYCANLYMVFIEADENITIEKDAFLGTEHLLFYINCDVNADELEKKLFEAKGDRNYEIATNHIDYSYDVKIVEGVETEFEACDACGYKREAPVTGEPLPFEDVSYDAWYYGYVAIAYEMGVINGKSENIFDPDGGMTCAESAKIAAVIHSSLCGNTIEQDGDTWYQPYVDYCYENKIIGDYIIFDWEEDITRAQMAYLFSRSDLWDTDINEVPITDIPDVDDKTTFFHEILELYNRGIMVGDERMAFFPDSTIKRSEAAAVIVRILNWDMRIELPKG